MGPAGVLGATDLQAFQQRKAAAISAHAAEFATWEIRKP